MTKETAMSTTARGLPVVLVCGWAGAGNIGDELLTSEVVVGLRRLGAEPVVVSRNPAETRALHNVASVHWGPRGWLELATKRQRINGVCVGPGGIIQDSSSVWSLPGHLLWPLLQRMRKRQVVGIGLGAEPLKRWSSRRLMRSVFAGSSVVARDAPSAETMLAVGVEAVVGADLAFGLKLDPLAIAERHARRNEIVVAVGPTVSPGRFLPASRRHKEVGPFPLAKALAGLAKRLDASVTFACFRGQRDRQYAQKLASHLPFGAEILPFRHTLSSNSSHQSNPQAPNGKILSTEIGVNLERIRSARLLISNRYHAIVVASLCGTPAVARSPEPKIRSLADQLSDKQNSSFLLLRDWAELETCSIPDRSEGKIISGFELNHELLGELVRNCAQRTAS